VTEVPRYYPEVRFYSKLGISYNYGSKLSRLGVIEPDAFMDNGAPLFLVRDEALGRHREAINRYRAKVARANENASVHA
jgi:hypothetical protein